MTKLEAIKDRAAALGDVIDNRTAAKQKSEFAESQRTRLWDVYKEAADEKTKSDDEFAQADLDHDLALEEFRTWLKNLQDEE